MSDAAGDERTRHRTFLVVADDSEEMPVALRFAAMRARRTGAGVALFHAIEPAGFHHWAGVGALMEDEAREAAEHRLAELAGEAMALSGRTPVIHIRSGPLVQQLTALVEEDTSISVLVLAAGTGKEGPGPLIAHLAGKGVNTLRVPITIVPGTLTDEQIDALT